MTNKTTLIIATLASALGLISCERPASTSTSDATATPLPGAPVKSAYSPPPASGLPTAPGAPAPQGYGMVPPSPRGYVDVPGPKGESAPNSAVAADSKATPTPHPAVGTTNAAIKLYPDLGVKDSLFNTTFRELYQEQKKNNPESLVPANWPIELAHRTAFLLGVTPKSLAAQGASPAVSAPPAAATPKREPGTLDKGAYNRSRDVRYRYYPYYGYPYPYYR